MRRHKTMFACIALTPILCYCCLRPPQESESDPYEMLAAWQPNAAAIHQELVGASAQPEAQRRRFAALFQQRFRDRDPALAIGMRFMDGSHIKLMFPARLEPWIINRLTIAAWRESQAEFGCPFDVAIYETFIGAAPVKIGELKTPSANSQAAQITYHYPVAVRHE